MLISNRKQPIPHSQIAELFQQDDHGVIALADGEEIYFHLKSLLNADIDKLQAAWQTVPSAMTATT